MTTEEEKVSAVHTKQPAPPEAKQPTEVLATLAPPEQSDFNLVFAEVFGSPPEFSGRFCEICDNTTPHARVRGKHRVETRLFPWLCTPCLLPGGAFHKIVNGLMTRQGEQAK